MKRKIVLILTVLLVITTCLYFNKIYNEKRAIDYNQMELRDIAWNSLSKELQQTVIKDENDIKLEKENDINIINNKASKDVWKYALVEKAKYKEISSLWTVKINMSKMEKLRSIFDNYLKWYKKDYPVIRVRFNTTQYGILGPITIYIDPENKEIIGSDVRY